MATLDMQDITRCVECGRNLAYPRVHIDTCGEQCFKTLLRRQRKALLAKVKGSGKS